MDKTFYYVNGRMGMKSNGSFTADQTKWVTFNQDEAQRFSGKHLYSATRFGVFIDTSTYKHNAKNRGAK